MKIDHIAMYVHDLEAAKAFFETYFGARANHKYHNTKTGFTSYFLSFDDSSRLEIMNRPDIKDTSKPAYPSGYIHLAFSVGNKESVDELTAQMVKDGYEIISGPRTTGDGYYESCIVAFEGNLIEITV